VIVALFIVVTVAAGFGLIAWWARDMLAARRDSAPGPAPARPRPLFHGPGLSPGTVSDGVHTDRPSGRYGE
jgi:hypothetical protein